jgi:hypothetical protein
MTRLCTDLHETQRLGTFVTNIYINIGKIRKLLVPYLFRPLDKSTDKTAPILKKNKFTPLRSIKKGRIFWKTDSR